MAFLIQRLNVASVFLEFTEFVENIINVQKESQFKVKIYNKITFKCL